MAQNTALTIPQVLLENKKKFDITSILAAAAREPQSPVISNTSSNSSSNSGSNSDPETSKHLERSPSPVEIIPNNEQSSPATPEAKIGVRTSPKKAFLLTLSRRFQSQLSQIQQQLVYQHQSWNFSQHNKPLSFD